MRLDCGSLTLRKSSVGCRKSRMYTKKIRYGYSSLAGERSSEADRGRQRGSGGPAEVCGCIGTHPLHPACYVPGTNDLPSAPSPPNIRRTCHSPGPETTTTACQARPSSSWTTAGPQNSHTIQSGTISGTWKRSEQSEKDMRDDVEVAHSGQSHPGCRGS